MFRAQGSQCRKLLHYIVLWTSSFFPIQTITILVFCANHPVKIGFQAIILISFHMTL